MEKDNLGDESRNYLVFADDNGYGFICHSSLLEKVHNARAIKINIGLEYARNFLYDLESNLPLRGKWAVVLNEDNKYERVQLDKLESTLKSNLVVLEGIHPKDVLPFCGVHWKGFDYQQLNRKAN